MHAGDPEVIPVRAEESLDVSALEPYLRRHLPVTDGAFQLAQFGGGHANLTYLVRFGDYEYVLRRPPLGPLPPHAHDMKREYKVLSNLYRDFPLAPRAFALCTDHAIVGSDFVVEERKFGIAIRRDLPENVRDDAALARRIGEMLVDTLASLHRVDPQNVGLRDLGRPHGFLERQLSGWIERWHAARTEGSIDAAALLAWLERSLPPSPAVALVHNDYKLDNMLLDPGDPSRIVALLDWDMCTLGDPLMDVGYMLALWPQASDPPAARVGAMPTWRPGFPTRREAAERYAHRTGFDLAHLQWYYIFNIFRFAAILQQIFKRFERGQTHDERFGSFGKQANALIGLATMLCGDGTAAP
ncbi:MAG TPA: phosphotransferase family protein [Candidatus Dormibacteraeota bacterium]|nr:phosphotransferase family protein [Candidatus Dormibacteraeota bacterium]